MKDNTKLTKEAIKKRFFERLKFHGFSVETLDEIDSYKAIFNYLWLDFEQLLAKKMEEVIPDLKKAYEIGGSGEEYPFIEEHKEMNKLISKYKQ